MPYNNTATYLIGCNTNNISIQTDMRMSSQDNSRILYFADTPEKQVVQMEVYPVNWSDSMRELRIFV